MQILLSVGCKPYHYQVAKSSILNEAEFLDPSLKTLPCTKTSRVLCENHSFFLLFWNVATFIKSHCVFLLLCMVWWSIFDQLFRWLLPLSCFYASSQWLLKVKITCKSKFHKKVKSDSAMYASHKLSQFSTLINLQPTCWYSVKVTKPFVLSISSTDIF